MDAEVLHRIFKILFKILDIFSKEPIYKYQTGNRLETFPSEEINGWLLDNSEILDLPSRFM